MIFADKTTADNVRSIARKQLIADITEIVRASCEHADYVRDMSSATAEHMVDDYLSNVIGARVWKTLIYRSGLIHNEVDGYCGVQLYNDEDPKGELSSAIFRGSGMVGGMATTDGVINT